MQAGSKRTRAAAIRQARRASVETLETRMLLSVSAQILAGPVGVQGNSWTYQLSTQNTIVGSETLTAKGATTYNGLPAIEIDGTATHGNTTVTEKNYYAFLPSGYVLYDVQTTSSGGAVDDTSYASPYHLVIPEMLDPGTPVTTPTVTETDTVTPAGGSPSSGTATVSDVITLATATPTVPIAVGGTTLMCYQINTTETNTPANGTQSVDMSQTFVSPTVGPVEVNDLTAGTTLKLSSFTGSTYHLAVLAPGPTNTLAGDTISPVQVAIENPSGAIDTSASDAVPITASIAPGGTGTGTLSGTTQVTTIDGVATFSSLSINKPGKYILNFTDSVGRTVASGSFDVSDDHLVFTQEPKSGDIKEPISFDVTAYTPENKVDTDATGDVSVSLDVLSGGTDATLNGTTTVALAGGRADFTASDDDNVAVTGTYELSANLADSTDSDARAAINPDALVAHPDPGDAFLNGISKPFSLSGFQLVFIKRIPAKDDPDAPIGFTVALEDKKHKIVTVDDGNYVSVTDASQVGDGEGSAFNYNAPYAKLEDGIAVFPTDSYGLSFTTPERYAIRVEEASDISADAADDTIVTSTNGALSNIFTIEPLQLVFTEQPGTELAGDPVSFKVAVEDFKHDVVSTEDAYQIDISTVYQIVPEKEGIAIYGSVPIVGGVATFSGSTGVIFNQAGTYLLEVKESSAAATQTQPIQYVAYTNPAKSKIFRVISVG
jgi:hypothetical protein